MLRNLMKGIIPVIILFSFFLSPASSQVYKWRDKDGNLHFSDIPPPRGDARPMDIRKSREDSGLKRGSPALPAEGSMKKRPYREIQVVMYMTRWCPYCRQARDYLNSLGVTLVQYDIEKEPDREKDFRRKGGKGVPLLDVEGIIVKGANSDQIKAAVETRRGIK